MLTMRCRFTKSLILSLSSTILIVFACSAFVFSQELTKQEPGKPTDTKQHSATYNRGTKDIPVVIEIGPSAPLKVETDRDKEAEKEKAINEGRIANGTIAIALFTCILACATIGLMIFTAKLWKSTNKLVVGAEETAKRQLRAYLFVDTITVLNIANPIIIEGYPPIVPTGAEIKYPLDGPLVMLTLKNYGQTPAYKVTHWAEFVFHEFPLINPLPPKPDYTFTTKADLAPGAVTTKYRRLPILTEDQITSLRNGNSGLYIYGGISYIDAFDEPQSTTFRYVHAAITGAIGITTDVTICEEGNEAT